VSNFRFCLVLAALVAAFWLAGRLVTNEYVFFTGYAVLQYILLATAWNLLGGYAGYINFGSAAFFALGAYISVALNKLVDLPVPVLILAGGAASGALGLVMGYLTLKLRGVFFSIATLALAIVFQAVITNWEFVGGSSGAYVIRPANGPWGGSYVEYLFYVMLILACAAVALARGIEHSAIGYGLAAIRDDEGAAEISGVPTLKLKVLATVLSGTRTWIGPVIGAILLDGVQETAMVTISSASNLLLVGLLMVAFITLAPNGIVGLVQSARRRK